MEKYVMSIFDNSVDLTSVPRERWKEFIAPGYRNISYLTVPGDVRQGRIVLFGYDTNGNRQTFLCPHESKLLYRVKYKTELKDIFGENLAKMTFKSSQARRKYLESMKGLHVVKAIKPEMEFLQEMFASDSFDDDFNTQKERIFFLDIETEISDGFMSAKDALNRINMITVYDTEVKKYITWSLLHADIEFHDMSEEITVKEIETEIKDYAEKEGIWYEDESGLKIDIKDIDLDDFIERKRTITKFTHNVLKDLPKEMFEFREFNDDERALLRDFLDYWERNCPCLCSGWNSRAFDLPYIFRRMEIVLGAREAQRLSPLGRVRTREPNQENERENKEADLYVEIDGVSQADILVLYRDKFNISPALDGGYGLSNVGEHEGLGTKIRYKGTLKDLYMKDYQKFYEYNIRDVDLLYRIEKKRKLIDLARAITSSGLAQFDTIYSSTTYLMGSLDTFSQVHMNGAVFPTYKNTENPNVSYEGAFVFEPIPGLYIGGIMVVDFSSLYPSVIRAMNCSPETYVGKISLFPIRVGTKEEIQAFNSEDTIDLSTCDAEEFYILPAVGPQRKITRRQLDEILEKKCIITRNNTLFLKHSIKEGLVTKWCEYNYNKRKSIKRKMGGIEKGIYEGKIVGEEKERGIVTMGNLNAAQQATKIKINSIYGQFGQVHSPIWNVYIAQTITRTGKFCNIECSRYISREFEKKYGKKYMLLRDGEKSLSISGDTDSCAKMTHLRIRQ
jgi:DNA polymerase elongation subunit (family B)